MVERCSISDSVLFYLSGDVPPRTDQFVNLLRLSGKCDLFDNVVFIVSEACTIPLSGTRYLSIFVTFVSTLGICVRIGYLVVCSSRVVN